jgi:hypothetical protein
VNSRNGALADYEMRIFDEQSSGERKLDKVPAVNRQRRVLASAKKIYGGAFSGHTDAFRVEEEEIINCFVKSANLFVYLPGKTVAANGKRLLQRAAVVVDKIRALFKDEVDIYLQHFSSVISTPSIPLRWDLDANNCQHFSQNLLRQLNISRLFHQIPNNYFNNERVKQKKQWPCPRYLLSFGSKIDTPIALLRPQDRSLIWIFYHSKRDDYDIIEYAEKFRTNACPVPTDAWEILCGEDITSNHAPAGQANELSMADALWKLPRDTISILQIQLMRGWARYSSNEGRSLSPKQWTLNRLRILHQLDAFASMASGLVTAINLELEKKSEFFPLYCHPDSDVSGTLYVSEKVIFVYRGDILIMFVTGRERDRWRRESKHLIHRLTKKIGFRNSMSLEE